MLDKAEPRGRPLTSTPISDNFTRVANGSNRYWKCSHCGDLEGSKVVITGLTKV
ncbi:hypothetical protein PAXRUDRAFT_827136 [Paxillus rubicundulus Ve08.2h10]|uniref:Uncharacterized protein n=1 Tax=Paxillus rubicundulus Ve08.2h10 TaxID=930991 RepID=A0A0D0DR64_9AGAM|nr:hypothetical protein PAXRUDRAFT_827136 [Paxillus rubicundulus Ve08.2h10]